jgi:hypothetical protein
MMTITNRARALLFMLLAVAAPAHAQSPHTTVDPVLTPGMVRFLSRSQVCTIKWGLDRRHITEKDKRTVAAWYGVPWEQRGQYEFDHLIPRQLAGADDVRNLWPQPLTEAKKQKDRLENLLHRLVCSGELSLHEAQEEIRRDWRASFDRRLGKVAR